MAKTENGQHTAEEARALIDADKLARAQGATEELNEFLKVWMSKWRVNLVPVFVMRGNNATHMIDVEALD